LQSRVRRYKKANDLFWGINNISGISNFENESKVE
jgi:hypothetical protein